MIQFFKKLFGIKSVETNKLLNKEEFGKVYFKKVQEKNPNVKLASQNGLELELELEFGEDDVMMNYLDNAFAEYEHSPEHLTEVLDKYVDALLGMINEREEDLHIEHIIPVVRSVVFFNSNKDLIPNFEEVSFYEKVNNQLYMFYVLDLPSSMRYIDKTDFESFAMSKDVFFDKAVENLNKLGSLQRQGEDGLYMLDFDGNFESSFLLLDIWNKENFDVKGDIVIAVPSRDVLLVTGSEDNENLIKMKEMAIDIVQSGDHIITDNLFIYKNGNFELFD